MSFAHAAATDDEHSSALPHELGGEQHSCFPAGSFVPLETSPSSSQRLSPPHASAATSLTQFRISPAPIAQPRAPYSEVA